MVSLGDPVVQATHTLHLEFIESMLYRAALETGFMQYSEQRAQEAYQGWQKGGFGQLPPWARTFVNRINGVKQVFAH